MKAVKFGVATFVATFIFLNLISGPLTCNSGWASPSIGSQGACSHHGGVDRLPGFLRFLASAAAGITVGNWVSKRNSAPQRQPANVVAVQRKRDEELVQRNAPVRRDLEKRLAPASGNTDCPTCNSPMIGVAEAGVIFLRCSDAACGHEAAIERPVAKRKRRRA
ncbi:MAG: hypothetical protein J0I42_20195 [Bosea sp.]|uniref:hypothetical protein n=1 Tax=Bosea sp. (in: a-proteobacteria) TaxID=1871050 RepID=UPI001ACFD947|nr:hypothetical protein [Bosea sp. (in: a-proteobacteria)]MBN9454264.1 hypothetical protein [Bosea sp. (in: a-proteobacteria)]